MFMSGHKAWGPRDGLVLSREETRKQMQLALPTLFHFPLPLPLPVLLGHGRKK